MLRKRLSSRPMRVGVLVDLMLGTAAGGHVKCWEHFAQAATRHSDEIDLTVHFSGDRDEERILVENVRYRMLRPAFSTSLLPVPWKLPDHTDLAPVHRRLQRCFPDYDLLHTTDTWFAYARTALRHRRQFGTPLVNSTHTDVPNYAQKFLQKAVQTVFPAGRMCEWLLRGCKVDRCYGAVLRRRLYRYFAACDHVLASNETDARRARQFLPEECVTPLRRGIDREFFHPRYRDRRRIEQRYRIPADRFLLLFAGRLDEAKQPMLLAEAARLLVEQGRAVHAVFVGQGRFEERICRELGPAATVIPPLPQAELRDLYAAADLFVFPSTTEVLPNVVVEAKASGLPVLLSRQIATRRVIRSPGEDGILLESGEPADWARAIDGLQRNEELRQMLRETARRQIEREWPSWDEVFEQDLLPVWERLIRRTSGVPTQSQLVER